MTWYLKKSTGEVYGPVESHDLATWASDGRVAQDDQVSQDQKTWIPAADLPELMMDWIVELRDGTHYGPIQLMAIRDLIHEGSVARDAQAVNRRTKKTGVVTDAIIEHLLELQAQLSTRVEALTRRIVEAEKRAEEAASTAAPQPGAGKRDKGPAEEKSRADHREAELQNQIRELKRATDKVATLQHEVDKWKKLYQEEETKSLKREEQLKSKPAAGRTDPGVSDGLRQEVEKWKKLYEQEKGRAQAQAQDVQAKPRGETVPRSLLEEAERRLAQIERSYQQLLRTVSRNLQPQTGGQPSHSAETLRRRDMS